MRGGEVDDDAGGGVDAAAACADSVLLVLLQVDAEDAHAVSVDVLGDGGVYDAVDDVVADGDEADGGIRISGIKTT